MTDELPDAVNATTSLVIGGSIKVHSVFGPGLLESAYFACLVHELRRSGARVATQQPIFVNYDGVAIDCAYRLDMLVNESVIVELKSIERFAPIHTAQMITYLRLTGLPVGLLINFNVRVLKDGIKRIINRDRVRPGATNSSVPLDPSARSALSAFQPSRISPVT